mgnify:CR=1 FL=1
MPDQREIYNRNAKQYERLVSKEDPQGNIISALQKIHPFQGHKIVELGAGTGRLNRMLAPLVSDIWLFDSSHHMLEFASKVLKTGAKVNWRPVIADHRNIPLIDGIADIVISGWTVCYLVAWIETSWRKAVGQALEKIERVLGQQGIIILLETLGTGYEKPKIPKGFEDYYKYLEEAGFNRRWIRTDLAFETLLRSQGIDGLLLWRRDGRKGGGRENGNGTRMHWYLVEKGLTFAKRKRGTICGIGLGIGDIRI